MQHEAVEEWALLHSAVVELQLRLDTAGETAWAGYFRRARQLIEAGDEQGLMLISQALRDGSEFTRMCRSYDRDGLSREARRTTRNQLQRASLRVAAMVQPVTGGPIGNVRDDDDIGVLRLVLNLVIFGSVCVAIVLGVRAIYADAISPGLKYSIASAVVAGLVQGLRSVMRE